MAGGGETRADVSAWTVDSLHALVDRLLGEIDLRYQQRFEGQQQALEIAVETQERALQVAIDAVSKLAISADLRYEQRFQAQQTALDRANVILEDRFATVIEMYPEIEALKAGDQLNRERVDALRRELQAAMAASKEAVEKSETTTETRFLTVDMLRAQLNDQSRMYLPRTESDASFHRISQQISDMTALAVTHATRSEVESRTDANAKAIQSLNDRLTRIEGVSKGINNSWGYIVAGVGLIATLLIIYLNISGLGT